MNPARRPFNMTRFPALYPTLHMDVQQSSAPAEADVLTARVQSTWTSGDFGRIARSYERGAAEFIARLELEPGDEVLDVACGTGNLASSAICVICRTAWRTSLACTMLRTTGSRLTPR